MARSRWLPSAIRLPERLGRRLYDWIRGSPWGLVAMALVIGLGAGLGAIAFRYLILWFTIGFTGHPDSSAVGREVNRFVPQLGIWFLVLAPVVGGLIYGPLIEKLAQEARGHGVPEVMLAVAAHGGRIRARVAVIKSLASAVCIGAGGSVGREGPIVQIGSALGSAIGQVLKVPESRLRLLVACGAAGGISATFNAPIAGALFGLELILRDFEAESFGVVMISSVAADAVGRAAFGSAAFLTLPPFQLTSPYEYLLYGGLGGLAGVFGVAFVRALYGTEDLINRVWRGPEWLRPAAGGVLLGLLLLALPQLYGVGYPVLEQAIRGEYALWLLALLLVGKILATSLTLGIGGSGGVFAPSLFMGAMLGSAYGKVLHGALPGIAGAPGAYGLVGMGALFASAARAPITSALILFEITDDYRIILPLLFAISIATSVGRLLSRDTIYTLKLRRRGIDFLRGRPANLMEILSVREAMQPAPAALRQEMQLAEALRRFSAEGRGALPVVDEAGGYRGTVTSRRLEHAMREDARDVTVGALAQQTPSVTDDSSLEDALGALVRHELSGLPVLAHGGRTVVGWLTHRDVLRAYHARREESARRVSERWGRAEPGAPPLAQSRGYRVVELELDRDRFPVGHTLGEIRWPPSALVLFVRRGGQVVDVHGDVELARGDRLAILVREGEAAALVDALGVSSNGAPPSPGST